MKHDRSTLMFPDDKAQTTDKINVVEIAEHIEGPEKEETTRE